MSDVERATSATTGDEREQSARATTTTTTATTTSTAAAKAAAVKLQQQQHYHQQLYHHQQQQQYNNSKSTIAAAHYCNNTSAHTPTATSTADSARLTHTQHHHHHHQHHNDHGHNPHQQQQQQQQHPSSNPQLHNTSTTYGSDCINQLLKIVFSTPGLVVLVVAYSVMGAFLFPLLEAPQDITKSEAIAKSREECLRELWIITEKLNVLYERNWTMLVHEQLRRFEGSIVAATRSNAVAGRGGAATTTALGRFGGSLDATDVARWTFSEALLYSVTVITTIGHGSLTPKTAAGKIATILYAIIGVPLMLMCLSSLGALLAEALQCTYARVCCRLNRHHGHHQQHRPHQHQHPANQGEKSGRIDGGGKYERRCSGASLGERVDDGGREMLKQPDMDCQSKGHAINCKNCKYDAIVGETNLSNCYGYVGDGDNVGGVSDLPGGRLEDSCQLLRNSPAKLNQNMATAAAPTAAQYYQQRTDSPQQTQQEQQQPQQQQQQHPDVMLMATAQKLPQQQQFYSRSATPSPQHFQQLQQQLSHPLQTFHIVSTASANSSPTHPQTMRQYATLQPHHHHHYQQQQLQQQHFVAVPSSLVRFQAATSNNCASGGSASNGGDDNGNNNTSTANRYQSASVPATASATIYFPIAATNGPPTSAAAATTAAAAAAVAASQLLCNQPLVKYHTIQLQHSKKPFITAAAAAAAAAASSGSDIASGTMPLPPPPAYQTATVHSVRRAKFLTKPLPPEINTLLAENDTSYRHDLLQHTNVPTAAAAPSTAATPAMATTTTAAPLAAGTLPASAATSIAMLSAGLTATTTATAPAATTATTTGINTSEAPAACSGSSAAPPTMATTATPAALGSSATVDIMEDEEEHEQQRLGNCPHGTPSRVPLISSSNASAADYAAGAKEMDKSTRSLINATAASFHRHTLHTFQRNALRKSVRYGARRGCNAHATVNGILAQSRGGCYGNTDETSDDEEYMQRAAFGAGADGGSGGTEQFKLKRLHSGNGDADEENAPADAECGEADDADDDCDIDGGYSGPQVPISVVLLILVCYICLGTVIFALWENWSIVDGAYFCFVTLATIGYGDFVPERTFRGPHVQLFACCAYLLLGLVLVAMSFSILETQLMWKCKRIAVRLKLAKD